MEIKKIEIRKIKAMLVEHGIKHKDIACALGVTRACVSIVLNGHQNSKRVKQAIADVLHLKVADLWPDKKEES